jgi:hypothetical protein
MIRNVAIVPCAAMIVIGSIRRMIVVVGMRNLTISQRLGPSFPSLNPA